MERKSISLELKDLDNSKRTAVIAHAVYNNIDRVGDISCKGMFDKSWQENKSIDFLFNHEPGAIVGNVLRTFDDEQKAYTEVKFGNWTLGNDVLEMADSGILKGASFGYQTEKKEYASIKGKKVRKLKEVKHFESSLLTVDPANPLAGVVALNKSFKDMEIKALSQSEQDMLKKMLSCDQSCMGDMVNMLASMDPSSDLYTWMTYQISNRASMMGDMMYQLKFNSGEMKSFKEHIDTLEKFCRNTKASDDCIKSIQLEIEEAKQILSNYDTAFTQEEKSEPDASKNGGDELMKQILILHTRMSQNHPDKMKM